MNDMSSAFILVLLLSSVVKSLPAINTINHDNRRSNANVDGETDLSDSFESYSSVQERDASTSYVNLVLYDVSSDEDEFSEVRDNENSNVVRNGSSKSALNWEGVMNALKTGTDSYIKSLNITDTIRVADVSDACRMSLESFFDSLSRWEKWAVMMADASGKIPGGILEGTTMDFGSYEECLKIRVYSDDEVENFRGRYCMIGYQSPLLTSMYKNSFLDDKEKYVETYGKPPEWIENFIIRSGKYLDVISFYLGTCVPSTCSRDDVQTIASHVVSPFELNVSVPACEVDAPKVWTTNGIIALSFFVILAHLCILGTLVDVACRYMLEDQHSLRLRLFISPIGLPLFLLKTFSLYLNSEKFFARSKDGNSLSFFNGMRFISFTWVVINHTWGIYDEWRLLSYRNFLGLDDELKGHVTVVVIEGAHVAVDTFFLISGFLLVYTTWRKLELSGGRLNVFRFMIQKFWRLSPSLGVTIALYMMYDHYGSGPIFKVSTSGADDACYTHWMWNFLYINNWWTVDKMCLPHTWFLSALMQSHLIGVILLLIAYRHPFAGAMLSAAIGVGTSILLAFINIFNNHPMPTFFLLKDLDFKYDFLEKVHFKTYSHINAYLVGMAVGFLFLKHNERKIKHHQKALGWILATLVALYVMEGKYASAKDKEVVALYSAIHRTAWALSVGWVIYICAVGHGGVVNRFLSWHGFDALSNISYLAYLLHILVICYRTSTMRERFQYGEVELVFEIILVTVVGCILSVMAYVTVEMPFSAIGALIFKR